MMFQVQRKSITGFAFYNVDAFVTCRLRTFRKLRYVHHSGAVWTIAECWGMPMGTYSSEWSLMKVALDVSGCARQKRSKRYLFH